MGGLSPAMLQAGQTWVLDMPQVSLILPMITSAYCYNLHVMVQAGLKYADAKRSHFIYWVKNQARGGKKVGLG